MDSIKLAKTIAVGRIVNSIAFETEEESNLVYWLLLKSAGNYSILDF